MLHANAPSNNSCLPNRLTEFLLKPFGEIAKPNLFATFSFKQPVPARNRKQNCPPPKLPDLNKSLNHRRTIIEMIAHDIRSPIMSSLVSLALVEEYFIDISEEGAEELATAEKSIEKTLERAQDLLSCVRHSTDLSGLPANEIQPETLITRQTNSAGLALQIIQILSYLTQQMNMPLQQAQASLNRLLLQCEVAMPIAAKTHLQRSLSGIQRALRLISDQPKMEYLFQDEMYIQKSPCSIYMIVEDAIESMKNLAEQKRIKLINGCSNEEINVDGNRVSQVICNYLSNAIKFSAENTCVKIASKKFHEGIRIEVHDEGSGISNSMRDNLFQRPAEPAMRKGDGHGLGLSICKMIAKAHGGEVGFECKAEKGCTFWMDLPI